MVDKYSSHTPKSQYFTAWIPWLWAPSEMTTGCYETSICCLQMSGGRDTSNCQMSGPGRTHRATNARGLPGWMLAAGIDSHISVDFYLASEHINALCNSPNTKNKTVLIFLQVHLYKYIQRLFPPSNSVHICTQCLSKSNMRNCTPLSHGIKEQFYASLFSKFRYKKTFLLRCVLLEICLALFIFHDPQRSYRKDSNNIKGVHK